MKVSVFDHGPGYDCQWDQQVFVVFVSVLANVINVRRDTLRACFVHAGNDHLLGAQEPPSAIISLCSMVVVRDMSQSL